MVNFFENFRKNFSAPSERGARTAAGGFALTGRLLSLHRLNGVRELPQAGSPLTGGRFFAEPQRGIRRRCGGNVAAPAAGAKRKGHLRFPFLFELLPFPCFLIRRRLPTCDRCEKGNGRGFFLCYGRTTFGVHPLEQPVRSVRYITATQVGYFQQARHNSVAQLFGML